MATQTESQSRSRGQNGQEQSEPTRVSEPTREQIREDQDRFDRLQERYQEQAHEQADEVKQQLQRANEIGRDALGQYVRGLTRGYQAFIPQAVVDPHQVVDFAFDFALHAAELQRSFLHELVGAGRVTARAANRAAEDLSDKR